MNAQQLEVERQIQEAKRVKQQYGEKAPTAIITKRWYSPKKYTIGFNFREGMNVGDTFSEDYGYKVEVLAVV
jgi:hypothetical protein